MQSKLFSLVPLDFLKAVVLAGITAGGGIVVTALEAGSISGIDWHTVGKVTLAASLSYLLKQFLSNNNGVPFKADQK